MLLIFDLDGTLIDSKHDLAHAVNVTREHLRMPPLEYETIYSYVGNGAPMLIRRALGPRASEADIAAGLEYFLEHYRRNAVVHTVLYPGVRESLERLHGAGHSLAILTNKPVGISRDIMDHFGLSRLMARIYGGNSFAEKKPHPIGIDTLRDELKAPRVETWMVGDSSTDIETARNAGVPACGVTYGIKPESLAECPPDLLVDRFEDFASRFFS